MPRLIIPPYQGTSQPRVQDPGAKLVYDEAALREPRLLVPGQQPLGPVRVDRSHPLGASLLTYFCACSPEKDIATSRMLTKTGVSIAIDRGNKVFSFSNGSIIAPVQGISPPFVLAVKCTSTSSSGAQRLLHFTKTVNPLESVTGIAKSSGTPNGFYAQHYNGTNYVSVATNHYAVPITLVAVFTSAACDLRLYVDSTVVNVNGGTGYTWASGVDIVTFGKANWGTEYFVGTMEWAGAWSGLQAWDSALEKSLVSDPYQFLIPA